MKLRYGRIGIALMVVSLAVALPLLWLRARLAPTAREAKILAAARQCLGDAYDSDYYEGGPPPRGRGACTDVIYWGYRPLIDLQKAVDQDRQKAGDTPRDRNIDYRWCPRLIVWFKRHTISLPVEVNRKTVATFRPGDVIFYADGDDSAGHVGLVSDRWSIEGKPYLIHNPGPRAVEENALTSNRIVGHFRLPGKS